MGVFTKVTGILQAVRFSHKSRVWNIGVVRAESHKTLEVPLRQLSDRAFVPVCEQSVRMDGGPNSRQTLPWSFVSESVSNKMERQEVRKDSKIQTNG